MRLAHAVLVGLFGVLAALILGVSVAARLGPTVGYELLAIRSGSMAPALPVGALAAVSTQRPQPIRTGEQIAYRLPSGTVVTHRVTQVIHRPAGTYYRTRGDANNAADPALVPAAAVVGQVILGIPLLGYLLGMLSMPTGLISIVSLAGSLIAAIWLLEDLSEDISDRQPQPGLSFTRPHDKPQPVSQQRAEHVQQHIVDIG